jgi:hypothetical protein
MSCDPLTLTGCLGSTAHAQASVSASTSGWDSICQSFANAAQQLLGAFARSFVSIPPVNLSYAGVRSVYGLSLEIAAVIAAVLLMVQVIRTVMVHDGSAIAQGLTGVGKAALAFSLTIAAAAIALRASDELTRWIIARTFGTPQALSARLAGLVSFDQNVSSSLLFVLALVGILLTLALWAQLLVRNVAVTVLVAVSPAAAAGQVAHATQQWWRKLVRTTLQLIALKPVVALVLAVGLTMPGTSGAVEKLLAGMLVLLLAGVSWPAIARATAVLEVYVGGGTLGTLRGGGSPGRAGEGAPSGIDPAELSRVAEARTMAAVHELAVRSGDAYRTGSRRRLPARLRPGPVTGPVAAAAPGAAAAEAAQAERAAQTAQTAQAGSPAPGPEPDREPDRAAVPVPGGSR